MRNCEWQNITGQVCSTPGQNSRYYTWRQNGVSMFRWFCEEHAGVMENLFPITFRAA